MTGPFAPEDVLRIIRSAGKMCGMISNGVVESGIRRSSMTFITSGGGRLLTVTARGNTSNDEGAVLKMMVSLIDEALGDPKVKSVTINLIQLDYT